MISDNLLIRKTYEISYPRKAVYGAWISPKTLVGPVAKVEVDLRVGGYIRVHKSPGSSPRILEGKFLVVEPRQRLVYSWCSGMENEETLVTINFADCDKGTGVDITQQGFVSADSRDRYSLAWDSYVKGVEQRLASD